VHAIEAQPQRLHEQNLDKAIAAWPGGEHIFDDRV
jgi:hypothetical protein